MRRDDLPIRIQALYDEHGDDLGAGLEEPDFEEEEKAENENEVEQVECEPVHCPLYADELAHFSAHIHPCIDLTIDDNEILINFFIDALQFCVLIIHARP